MSKADRYFSTLLLALALAVPMTAMAIPAPQEAKFQVKIYDRNHKDYHNWDDHENQAWGAYRADNHKKAVEYSKASKKDQSNYWDWRHSHPDKN